MFNGGAVSWKSRQQDSVSLSTSEAEFVAANQCAQEVLYLREILRDFHQTQQSPTLVHEHNLAYIAMSETRYDGNTPDALTFVGISYGN
jgi:hypothetical protein